MSFKLIQLDCLLKAKLKVYNHICPCGSVVEHTLGKGEVTSSILVTGSCCKVYVRTLNVAIRKLMSFAANSLLLVTILVLATRRFRLY